MVDLHNREAALERLRKLEQEKVQLMTLLAAPNVDIPEEGTPISKRDAAQKYGVARQTIARWVEYGWVKEVGKGPGRGGPVLVDEHDVAITLRDHPGDRGPNPGFRHPS